MPGVWTTRGFEAFRRGSFGDVGKNLYVSRAGVLQRIHCFDLNGDGYLDLLFCNSQAHWETPPAYVYHDPLAAAEPAELPTEGARSGVVADLNGDGYDDLVLGMYYNGSGRISTPPFIMARLRGWPRRGDNPCPRPSAARSQPAILTGMGGST